METVPPWRVTRCVWASVWVYAWVSVVAQAMGYFEAAGKKGYMEAFYQAGMLHLDNAAAEEATADRARTEAKALRAEAAAAAWAAAASASKHSASTPAPSPSREAQVAAAMEEELMGYRAAKLERGRAQGKEALRREAARRARSRSRLAQRQRDRNRQAHQEAIKVGHRGCCR